MADNKTLSKHVTKIVEEETKEYCDTSTIHGFAHFFTPRFNIVERLFWMVLVAIMISLAFVLINTSFVAWNATPTVISIDSTNNPVSAIQFPTVTLCNDFTADRFGFTRNVLNTFKFESTDADVADTMLTRQLVNGLLSRVTYNLRGIVDSAVDHDNPFVQSLFDVDGAIVGGPILALYQGGPSDISDFLGYLNCKLDGSCNNYDIFAYLDISEPLPADFPHFEHNNYDNNMLNYLATTYAILALPSPGNLGSYYINFENFTSSPTHWIDEPTFSMSIWGIWEVHKVLWSLMDAMMNITDWSLTGGVVNPNVSFQTAPHEIAAILSPVPTYLASQKFPRQFPETVSLLQTMLCNSTEQLTTMCLLGEPYIEVPAFLNVTNFFGEILGRHLMMVMEIMFHCTLRAKPMDGKKFFNLKTVYGNIFNETHFLLNITNILGSQLVPNVDFIQVNILQEPFYPKWSDYSGVNNATPYFWNFQTTPLLFENIPYPLNNKFYTPSFDPTRTVEGLRLRYQYLQMISYCSGPGSKNTCDGKFQPTLTDSGICHTFNAQDFNSAFVSNTYIDMFQQVFQPDNNNSVDVLNNENNGNGFQMFLVLDSFQSKIYDNLEGTFKVGISNMFSFMGIRDTLIEVPNGHMTTLSITPIQYKATDGLKNLDVNTRQCRYADEMTGNNSLFTFYSHGACTYECRLNNSRNACGCTPWNYPQYGNDAITQVCDGVLAYCFETAMGESYDCGCLPDCESITFSVTADKTKLNYGEKCNAPRGEPFGMTMEDYDVRLTVGEKIRHMDGEEMLFWFNYIKTDGFDFEEMMTINNFYRYVSPTLTEKMCESLLENDFALLSIQVATPKFTIIVQDVSATFTTKVAVIGGTLGLFTGMSIVSFFEVGFMIYRILISVLKKATRVTSRRTKDDVSSKD